MVQLIVNYIRIEHSLTTDRNLSTIYDDLGCLEVIQGMHKS